MDKDSLKGRIYIFLKKNPQWVNGGELERLAMSVGYKGSSASRELRYLAEDGLIEKEERHGLRVRSVWYKVKLDEYIKQAI